MDIKKIETRMKEIEQDYDFYKNQLQDLMNKKVTLENVLLKLEGAYQELATLVKDNKVDDNNDSSNKLEDDVSLN